MGFFLGNLSNREKVWIKKYFLVSGIWLDMFVVCKGRVSENWEIKEEEGNVVCGRLFRIKEYFFLVIVKGIIYDE